MTHTLTLTPHRSTRLAGASRLCVDSGTLWLTIDGDPDDHVLERGDCLALPPRANAVVQALGATAHARVDGERSSRAWWQPIAAAWRAVGRRGALP